MRKWRTTLTQSIAEGDNGWRVSAVDQRELYPTHPDCPSGRRANQVLQTGR